MPKGYWVGRVDVIKPEAYQAYGVALAEVLRKYGANFLVRGGTFEAVEGKARGRNIVLEFKDYATALAWLPLARILRSEGATRGCRGHRHHRDRRLRRATADGLIASPALPWRGCASARLVLAGVYCQITKPPYGKRRPIGPMRRTRQGELQKTSIS